LINQLEPERPYCRSTIFALWKDYLEGPGIFAHTVDGEFDVSKDPVLECLVAHPAGLWKAWHQNRHCQSRQKEVRGDALTTGSRSCLAIEI
jgi:hypothetical protein